LDCGGRLRERFQPDDGPDSVAGSETLSLLAEFDPESRGRDSPAARASVEIVQSGSAIVWERGRIRALAARFPRLTENVLGVMYKLLVRMFYIHMSLSSRNAAQRLRQAVVDLSYGIGRAVPHGTEIDITNEELANMANVTMFTASRYLSEWERRGAIKKKRGAILLRSEGRLLSMEV